jgi:hypothetical protein
LDRNQSGIEIRETPTRGAPMPSAQRDPGPQDESDDPTDREPEHDEPNVDEGDAYERAQPSSQPTVSSDPEPDHEPADAG